jgi:PAS domain S-box-containing protein
VVDFVNRYRCADGTRRWLQWRATPYAENQRTIAVARDITVARQREAALRDSEKRYRLLVENMSDGVAVYDGVGDGQDFVFLDVNKAGERIGGIAKHSVIGRSVRDIFPAVVEMGLFDIFQRVWRTGIPQRHEASRYQDERLSLWVENYVFKLPGGQIVSVFKDLTGMKQKEEQLVASELLFRTLFEKAPIGMNVVAADGTPARVNLALQRLLGYSEAEFCREHFRAWTHPDDVTSSLDLVERLRRGEADSLSIDKRYLRKDGGTVWAHTSVAAVRNANGDIDYFITMIEDVTERRGREEQARRLTDENRHLARRLLRIQEDERESIARELHDEIGQSITGIRADVQAIDAYCRRMPPGPDRDGVEASVNAIEQVAQRLYESAHSLMRQLHPSLLDDLGLRAGLEDMLQTWCDRHRGIRCQVEITDQLGRIAKPVALVLFRIVQEALANIAKHAAANAISVRLTLRPDSRDDAHSVYLQITDDGRGFDASQPTLGIGLAGMRERVLAKGGTLAVDTSPGQGVVIRVRIPVADGRKPI